jgi:Protein of unknown function (DUF5818)
MSFRRLRGWNAHRRLVPLAERPRLVLRDGREWNGAAMAALLGWAHMSKGEPLEITGILETGPHGLIVEATGGGVWQLGPSRRARRLIGREVSVRGLHGDFAELTDWRIESKDGEIVREADFRSEFAVLMAALAFIALVAIASLLA